MILLHSCGLQICLVYWNKGKCSLKKRDEFQHHYSLWSSGNWGEGKAKRPPPPPPTPFLSLSSLFLSPNREPGKFGNFKIKLSLNLSLTHLRAQIACYELKGDLRSVMLKEIFHDSLKISKFTRICMENHSSVTGWQKLLLRYMAENWQVT